MGSPVREPCRDSLETPHEVTLTHRCAISTTEVTQAQFQAAMGYNPSHFSGCGGECPVETVSWHEAVAYCNALSQRAGLSACYACAGDKNTTTCQVNGQFAAKAIYDCPGYRLPTEAEWEYAYRAGSVAALYNGPIDGSLCKVCPGDGGVPLVDKNADGIAWYCANAGGIPHPVGQKKPNARGLFDMAGNVHEWCHDLHRADLGPNTVTDPVGDPAGTALDSQRAMRGGAWDSPVDYVRAAFREAAQGPAATMRFPNHGFRCARTVRQ